MDEIEHSGFQETAKMVGDPDILIKIVYDGDIKKYYNETDYQPYKITDNGMIMCIDDVLVRRLNLKDFGFRDEKLLGDFSYGRNGFKYKLSVRVYRPVPSSNVQHFWKVVGQSGDSGFGYPFIRKSLGKRARMQIFQQIIDKYNLGSYK